MRIAVFTKNLKNPAYGAARLGADRAARRLGAVTTQYVPEQPDNVEEQIALIDTALKEPPDAAVLVPVHPTAVNDAIRRITAAGIPLIGFLNRFSEPGPVVWVGADDYALGTQTATYLYEKLGGRGRVVIFEGVAHSVTSRERVRAFRDARRRFRGIEIVATVCGEYLREPARRAASALLDTGVAFDAVLAANDDMAIGALQALEQAGRKATVIGINAIPEAVAAVREGKLLATIDFNALDIATIATEAAVRHLRGEKLPAEIILTAEVVDATNYARWDRPLEEREPIAWEDAVR